MGKQRHTLEELSLLIKDKENYICANIAQVILQNEIVAEKIAKTILEFTSIVDEVYARLIQKESGVRPKQSELLNELNYINVSLAQIEAMSKLKKQRNYIAHAPDIVANILNRYERSLWGLRNSEKLKTRVTYIANNLIEDVQYSYIS